MQKLIISLMLSLSFLSIDTFGQDFKYLEVKAENAKTWEEQFDTYITLVDTLLWRTYDHLRAEKYAKKALFLSQKHKDKTKELLTYSYLADVQEYFDNREIHETIIFPKLEDGNFTDKYVEARFNEEAGWYYFLIDFKKCLNYLQKAKAIYDEYYPNEKRVASINAHLPILFYVTTGELFKHRPALEETLAKAKLEKDTVTIIDVYNTFLVLNNIEGNTKKEMEYFLKADALYDHFKTDAVYFHKSELAAGFQRKKEFKKAKKIQDKLLQDVHIAKLETKYKARVLGHIHTFMVERFYLEDNVEQAFQHLDSAKFYNDLTESEPNEMILSLEPLVYIKAKKYKEGERLLKAGLKNKTINDIKLINGFNQLYQNSSLRPDAATMNELDRLMKIQFKYFQGTYNKDVKHLQELDLLFNIFKNNQIGAIEAMKALAITRDSLEALNSSEAVNELYVEYETKEKEQELKMKELQLAKTAGQQNLLIGGIIALFLIGAVSVWYFRNRNQLLEKDLENKKIIEHQAKELQVLYDSKNRFFANIAHELRTPLTLIAGPISTINQRSDIPVAAQQSLNIVHRNITYLKQLVNQILDLSKKDVKKLSLQISQFDFSEMLNALISDFQPFADYQNIEFQQPNNMNKRIELITDGEKLFIVLKNLLSNAFKYTHSNGQVRLNYVEMGEMLQVSVQDTGRGISKTDMPYIFNPYFQTTKSDTPIEGGTGIGLAISKEYIESLGGTIQVNSELNKGSTFVIQFPKKLAAASTTAIPLSFQQSMAKLSTNIKTPPLSTFSEETPTLLIVEDNIDICHYLRTLLQDDYQIIFANNGVEGLQQLENYIPDLIITDLMMPVMDGFEFMTKVKSQDKWRPIPIITLTARSEMTEKLNVLRIGVDDYLVKPFLEEELKLRIKNLLNNSNRKQAFLDAEIEKTEALDLKIKEPHVQTDNEPKMKATPVMSQEDAEWLKSIETIVKERIGNLNFNVNQLCLEMAVSSSQLYQKLKKLTGLTPKQYIDQIRYAKARKLLEMQVYGSIKRVAYEVGFKDEKHFSRNFKRRFGNYPSNYLE